MQRRLFFIFLGFFIGFYVCKAQNGPAGIGNEKGTENQPENLIWLDASDLLSFSDGSVWIDKSGNGNNATHINEGGNAPLLSTNSGQNALSFDGSASYLQIQDDDSNGNRLDGMEKLAIFTVFSGGTTGPRSILSKRENSSNRSYTLFYDNNFLLNGYAGNTSSFGKYNVGDATNTGLGIGAYIFDNDLDLYYNGNLQYTENSGATIIPDRNENICIGRFDESDNNRWFDGQISELLVYRGGINKAQQIIIENYLSQKYDITLTSNDIFTPTDLSYINDIAGVGCENKGTHNLASSGGLYIALRDSTYGDYVMASNNGAINDINSIQTVSVADKAWNRTWYIEKTGTPTVHLSFDLSEGIGGKYPQDISNYVLLRKNTPSGNYYIVNTSLKGVEESDRIYFEVENSNFLNGYYTLGTLDEEESPVEGGNRRIWYSLRSTADWNSPDAWTLEPCGCLPNNPDGYTPITSPTAASDKVVILSGKKITIPVGTNNLANGELVVEGELDFQTTKGHYFATISGNGIVLMAADNFPTGDASDFISKGEGEGKVQFYGSGYTISNDREFFNVEFNLNSSGSEVTLISDLVINGDLEIDKGIVNINDDTSTSNLIFDVSGDLSVSSEGQLLTGTGAARHQLNLYGDLRNQGGVIKFTNRNIAIYNSDATDGIVDVNFLNDTKDQLVTCNGVTNFYRIEIDKGDDDTYVLSVNASETGNFKLFGRANYSHSSIAQLTTNDNALGLLRGTIRLGQNVVIDQLNTSGNYNISEAACLWVDGGSVMMSTGNSLVPYGTVKVSSGSLSALVRSGITLRDNGNIQIEGGTINTNQIRTSILGSEHQGGYLQTGGTVNIVGGSSTANYYLFNLTYEGNTFQMSGGTLNVQQANSKGGIFINSLASNCNVTGGTVIANIGNSNDFVITSRAPFYNLILEKSVSNSNLFVLDDGVDVGSTDVALEAQALKVLNDFRIRGDESATDYPDITF